MKYVNVDKAMAKKMFYSGIKVVMIPSKLDVNNESEPLRKELDFLCRQMKTLLHCPISLTWKWSHLRVTSVTLRLVSTQDFM